MSTEPTNEIVAGEPPEGENRLDGEPVPCPRCGNWAARGKLRQTNKLTTFQAQVQDGKRKQFQFHSDYMWKCYACGLGVPEAAVRSLKQQARLAAEEGL